MLECGVHFTVGTVQTVGEAAFYRTEPDYDIVARLCYERCFSGVLVREGVNRNVGIVVLYLVGYAVDKTEQRTGVASFFFIGSGAFFAFAVIEQVILTVMRKQVYLLLGFVLASVTAFFVSNPLVKKMGLMGAGCAYSLSATVLFGVLGTMIVIFFIKEKGGRK